MFFVEHHDGHVELVARDLSVDEFLARMRTIVPPREGAPVSVEAMNEAIADHVAEDVMRSLGQEPRGTAARPAPARPRRRRAA